MIKIEPRLRNEAAIERLIEFGQDRQHAARRVHRCADHLLDALHCLDGGIWRAHMDHEAGLVSFSRDLA